MTDPIREDDVFRSERNTESKDASTNRVSTTQDALAYAIEHHEHHDSVAIVACGRGRLDYCIPAILATPQMQAIASQAAIGAAVERVEAIGGRLYCDGPRNPGWSVTISSPFESTGPARCGSSNESLAEAIAAALGEDDD